MDLGGKQIVVTGATGFLGRYIIDALQRRGAKITGAVRRPDRVPELLDRGVEMRRADLLDRDALTEAFRGADALVSNAALFSVGNTDWDEHRRVNVRGTENVFQAARAAGVRRVVHISSIAVYRGRVRASGAQDEQAPMLGEEDLSRLNVYNVSKALSERRAWELARELHLHLTVLRPGPIFGAHDPNLTPILKRVFGFPLALTPTHLQLPFVYAGDVAEAVARALNKSASVGKAYNVAGDSDFSTRELARAWASAGGKLGPLQLPLPVPLSIRIDNSRAKRELGWSHTPLVEALEETFASDPELLR